MQNMENVILLTVQNLLTKEQLKQIISDLINNGELSDNTKMIYVELLSELK